MGYFILLSLFDRFFDHGDCLEKLLTTINLILHTFEYLSNIIIPQNWRKCEKIIAVGILWKIVCRLRFIREKTCCERRMHYSHYSCYVALLALMKEFEGELWWRYSEQRKKLVYEIIVSFQDYFIVVDILKIYLDFIRSGTSDSICGALYSFYFIFIQNEKKKRKKINIIIRFIFISKIKSINTNFSWCLCNECFTNVKST